MSYGQNKKKKSKKIKLKKLKSKVSIKKGVGVYFSDAYDCLKHSCKICAKSGHNFLRYGKNKQKKVVKEVNFFWKSTKIDSSFFPMGPTRATRIPFDSSRQDAHFKTQYDHARTPLKPPKDPKRVLNNKMETRAIFFKLEHNIIWARPKLFELVTSSRIITSSLSKWPPKLKNAKIM